MAPAFRRAGPAQLVYPAVCDGDERQRRPAVQHPQERQITDVAVVRPSPIDSFNNASYGAIVSSNPTEPLPPEYPVDQAFFTVTFYYNEEAAWAVMPTRTQQLGLLILLTALAVYVFIRIAR